MAHWSESPSTSEHFFSPRALTFDERSALLIRAYLDARRDPAFLQTILACYPAVCVDMLDDFCGAVHVPEQSEPARRSHEPARRSHEPARRSHEPARRTFEAGSVNDNLACVLGHRLFYIQQRRIVPELPMQILLLAAMHTATSSWPLHTATSSWPLRGARDSWPRRGARDSWPLRGPAASRPPPLGVPSNDDFRVYLEISPFLDASGCPVPRPDMFLRAAANVMRELKIYFGERDIGHTSANQAAAAISRVVEESSERSESSFATLGAPTSSWPLRGPAASRPATLGAPQGVASGSDSPSPFAPLLRCAALRRVELDSGLHGIPGGPRRLLPTVIGYLPPSVEHLSLVILTGAERLLEDGHWPHPLPATVTSVDVCADVDVMDRGLGTLLARATHIRRLSLHSGNHREGVRHVPRILENKPLLETLSLKHTAVDLPELRAIRGLARLETLELERVTLRRDRAFVDELASLGRSLPRLRSVSFSPTSGDDDDDDDPDAAIVDFVRGLRGSKLESFAGHGTFTRDLADALPSLCSLHFRCVIDLRASLPVLVEFIRDHATSLRHVHISAPTPVAVQSILLRDDPLVEALAQCPDLRSIRLPYSIRFAANEGERLEFCEYIARVIASLGTAVPGLGTIHGLKEEIIPYLGPRFPGVALVRDATEETNRWRRREATGHAWAVVVANIQQNRETRFHEMLSRHAASAKRDGQAPTSSEPRSGEGARLPPPAPGRAPSLRSELQSPSSLSLGSVPTRALWTIHDFLPRDPVELTTI